ncbi:MAG: hypothetical protein KDE00_12635 [Rhodobacteraceae bacterium]|nr:hypothetical protein [Paracoccaceae bacterium]
MSAERPAGLPGLLVIAAAVALCAAALVWPPLAALDGRDRWAVTALALALLVFGLCLRRRAPGFAVLAGLFLLGGAAQLYLTEPLWFPALKLRPEGAGEVLAAGILALEGAAVLWAVVRLPLLARLRSATDAFGGTALLALLIASAWLSSPILIYVWRGAATAYAAHVVVGGVLILMHLLLLLALGEVKSPVGGLYRLAPFGPAAVAVVASLVMGGWAFDHLPHVEDEVAYLFQAQGFAHGALSFPAPPEAARPGLAYYLLDIQDGRWISTSVPGWPAALAPFVALGLPWLLNPLLAGLAVLLGADITRRVAGQDEADLVALLMGTSPWIIAAASSLMPHMLVLVLMLFAWWMILRSRDGHGARRLFAAGLAMGWIFATRPLDGVILGVLTALWVFAGPGGSLARTVQYGVGCVLTGSLLLLHNLAMTGNPLKMALSAYLAREWGPEGNAFGFGPDIGPPGGWGALDLWPGHSPSEAVLNTINLAASLQFDLLGWSIGSLALFIAFILWRRGWSKFDVAMVMVVVAVVGTMACYWFADSYYFGPRYWFPAAFAFFYLSARGFEAVRIRLGSDSGPERVRLYTAVGLSCLFGLMVFTPWRGVTKFHEYGNFHAAFRDAARTGQFGNAVVILTERGDEGTAFVMNDPYLSDDRPIFLLENAALDDDALRAAFPGREVVHFDAGWTAKPGR